MKRLQAAQAELQALDAAMGRNAEALDAARQAAEEARAALAELDGDAAVSGTLDTKGASMLHKALTRATETEQRLTAAGASLARRRRAALQAVADASVPVLRERARALGDKRERLQADFDRAQAEQRRRADELHAVDIEASAAIQRAARAEIAAARGELDDVPTRAAALLAAG